jgi:hypothetical protein
MAKFDTRSLRTVEGADSSSDGTLRWMVRPIMRAQSVNDGTRSYERGTSVALLCVVACLLVACSSSSTSLPPFDGALPLGMWGGNNTGMIVGDTAMHLHIGCTFGDVSGRVPIDANGQFDVQGSYMLRAYPITIGPPVPARFTGRLNGATATITVTVNDTVTHTTVVLGPAVLTFGAAPQMGPCPICRRPVLTQRRGGVLSRLLFSIARSTERIRAATAAW